MAIAPPEDIVAGVRELPALPALVAELLQLLGDDALGIDQLATRIARDPALTAKTMRLANSPFYGRPRRVRSIGEAVSVLGLRTLRSVALAAGFNAPFPAAACQTLDFAAYWRHSLGTALCAQALAPHAGFDADAGFTLGLLHDIGRLVLASRYPLAYEQVRAVAAERALLLHEAEVCVFGVDHAELGAQVALHWHFAPEFAQAIAAHHEPRSQGSAGGLDDLLHVADNMAHALDLSGAADDAVPPLSMAAWTRMALDDARCVEVFRSVQAQHRAVCDALSM